MKAIIFLLLILPFYSLSQQIEFNLTGIEKLNVVLKDQDDCLALTTYQNLITETKLKLKAAGIKLDSDGNNFVIAVYKVTTNNLSIWIRIEEKIEQKRKGKLIKTNILSYSHLQFFNIGLLGDYNTAIPKQIENMINVFINQYLQQNE